MRFLIVISFLTGFNARAQEDSTRVVNDTLLAVKKMAEIEVIGLVRVVRMETPRYVFMDKAEVEALQAVDVGEVLQKFQGTTLRSYGGLGGLKTISVRSLGSQHSAIVIDGFISEDHQTGQVNLAQLQTNNVDNIGLSAGNEPFNFVPVSAQVKGSSLVVNTFEWSEPTKDVAIRANAKAGSFGQISGYGAVKWRFKKAFISGYGNYRQSKGDYAYSIPNGVNAYTGVRTNNDYQDNYAGCVIGIQANDFTRIRIGYKMKGIDQGLPGAVILYNSTADERLTTSDHVLTADVRTIFAGHVHLRWYASGNQNTMRYFDPTYANAAGFIDRNYDNRTANSGIVVNWYKRGINNKKQFSLWGGVEGGLSDLKTSDSLFAMPVRKQLMGYALVNWRLHPFTFKVSVSSQWINEENRNGEEGKDVFALNPFAAIELNERGKMRLRHRLWYRNSLRIPSFNELYYNNVGNTSLDPERANQFGYNFEFIPRDKEVKWEIKSAAFFNQIHDQIVAIPTQNLFIWSIQNIGKVHVFGGEFLSMLNYTFGTNKKWEFQSTANYTYQRSINVTDKNHPTYGHQIAYIPQHTANLDASIHYQSLGFRISNYFVSDRYSLNENNLANQIDGFITSDLSLFYRYQLSEKHQINFQFQVKNAWNQSYAYIRSFVMPGRNYILSISYAFN